MILESTNPNVAISPKSDSETETLSEHIYYCRYGSEVVVAVQEEDSQPITEPIIAPKKVADFDLVRSLFFYGSVVILL